MAPRKTATATRVRLTRERVIAAAIALADRDGLEGLSMRRLGEELGVEAMSIYNHVANKDDLINGMADAVFGEIELPSHSDDWKTAIRKRSISFREVLARHPWATSVRDSGTNPGPATLAPPRPRSRHLPQRRIHCRRRRRTPSRRSTATSTGSRCRRRVCPFTTPEETAAMAEIMLAQLPRERIPVPGGTHRRSRPESRGTSTATSSSSGWT